MTAALIVNNQHIMPHPNSKVKKWSAKELEIIANEFPTCQTKLLAQKLNVSTPTLYHKAYGLGLKKDKEYLQSAETGRLMYKGGNTIGTHFKPGLIPWNKGKKGLAGANKTSFSAGHSPKNKQPIGTTSIDSDGYIRIKLDNSKRWKVLHRHVWEQEHGAVPKGYFIVFKDGNKLNTDISNLEMVSQEEMMRRNSIQRFPEELIETIRTLNKLKRKIKEHGEE